VEYLLFAGEAALTDKVRGSSQFSTEFPAQGKRDSKGRSLRDFDLNTRLFRYPCSYLVYSDAIEKMPLDAKQCVQRRLWEILSGKDTSKTFAHLSSSDRVALGEILRETNPEIRTAWTALEQSQR
jgi:hypothetical protein